MKFKIKRSVNLVTYLVGIITYVCVLVVGMTPDVSSVESLSILETPDIKFVEPVNVSIVEDDQVEDVDVSESDIISEGSENTEESDSWYMYLTPEEQVDLATLVYLEAGCESYECQKGVASVVVNRMTQYDQTLHEVVYAKNQFSPAYLIESSTYDDTAIAATMDVLSNGPIFPENVLYFRADYYHNWGYGVEPYCVIDNTYFSYDSKYEE